MLHPSLYDSEQMTEISIIITWHILCFQMMFASKVSRRGNKCTKVYATGLVYSVASRSEAHKIFLLLFKWDFVL